MICQAHVAPRRPTTTTVTNRRSNNPTRRFHVLIARANVRYQDEGCHLAETKKDLDLLLNELGFPRALLPGEPKAKAAIDRVLQRLEAMSPVPTPLRDAAGLRGVSPLLLGEWDLVYASNGTVVTRTALAQLLLSASQLPGVGLGEIAQVLSLNDAGALTARNSAVFGFGPFGSWRIGIEGVWRDGGDGKTAKVLFDRVSVRPVSALGLPLPSWIPSVTLATGGLSKPDASRSGADWVTTYVDADLRIGRGRTGNTFLFRRRPPK